MIIGCVTRDNPFAVASLIGSLLQYRPFELIISDASQAPIIQHPHLARLLGFVHLNYAHEAPDLVQQRISIYKRASRNTPILIVDDDLVFITDPVPAYRWVELNRQTVFGFKVDVYNDRGYQNFAYWSLAPTPHSFTSGSEGAVVNIQRTDEADMGLVCGVTDTLLDQMLTVRDGITTVPGIADNITAKFLAQDGLKIHRSLKAWHIGNVGNWWQRERDQIGQELYGRYSKKHLDNV